MYRISIEETIKSQDEYKKRYKSFRPFKLSDDQIKNISFSYLSLIHSTQNGQDTDDYCIDDNNKIERYLKNIKKNSSLLILGTGTGREMLVAEQMGLDTWGTTFGSRNIDYATEYLNISPGRIIECNNDCLPFGKQMFDYVAGFQVFEHTVAPLLFLLEQGRVLKMGGTLLLEWPPAANYTMDSNPHHQVCFTPGQAKALFQKAGFSSIELFYDNGITIPESDYWNGNQTAMLVIKGIKTPSTQEYINNIWNR